MNYKSKYKKYKKKYNALRYMLEYQMKGGANIKLIAKQMVDDDFKNIDNIITNNLDELNEIISVKYDNDMFKHNIIIYDLADIYENNDAKIIFNNLVDNIDDLSKTQNDEQQNLLIYVIIKKLYHEDNQLIKKLLEKKININEEDSHHNSAIYYALCERYNDFLSMIKSYPLNDINELFIGIKDGYIFCDFDTIEQKYYGNIYIIANIYHNFNVVNCFPKKFIDEMRPDYNILAKHVNPQKNVYNPMLFTYNISEIKNYLYDIYKQIEPEINYDHENVTYIGQTIGRRTLFDIVKYNGKLWIKKPNIDRYLGAKHLKKFNINVPNKIIMSTNKKDFVDINVEIIFSELFKLNPIEIIFRDLYTLSEYKTDLKEIQRNEMSVCKTYLDYGYNDWNTPGNCMQSNNNIIIVDTGLDAIFDAKYYLQYFHYLKKYYENTFCSLGSNGKHHFILNTKL
jgi:hypothetical protein